MPKQEAPISVRLTPEMEARVRSAAEQTKLPKNAFARQAIEAAVEAVEAHDGEMVVPIKFDVKKVPSPRK